MDRTFKWYMVNVVLSLALVMTFVTIGAHAVTPAPIGSPAIPPIVVQQNTTYQDDSGGIASDTCPNAILHVAVIDIGGSGISNVVVDVSQVNTTGQLSMVQDGSVIINGSTALVYSANVYVDKVIRPGGAKLLPVTATDNAGNSGSTSLLIIAFTHMGVSVIGYDSSKATPAHPANVSFFYDRSPVKMVVTSIDGTKFTNVTASFASVDGSTSVEYDNSGVLQPDGNYSYDITHTLGTIPGLENVNQAWINVTLTVTTPYGDKIINIPQIGALTILGNFNPKEDPSSDLGGDTTDWHTIPDYSAAYLIFEPVNSSTGKIAKLQFNEPIDLTDYTTAMQMKHLGEMLRISGKSMDLNVSADALIAFNKAATLTIYNLTAFTIDPNILQNDNLVPPSSSVVTNKTWDNSTKTLTFSVAHWTKYSWDGEPPSLSSLAVDYPTNQTSVKSGQSVKLHAIVTDAYSGVQNVTVDATRIGSGLIIFSKGTDDVWSNTTVVNAANGNYSLIVTAYDKAANKNTGSITVSVNNNITSPKTTAGVFRASTGYWYLDYNNDGKVDKAVRFGKGGDTPVVGDWNNTGTSGVGVFRKSTGYWYLDSTNDEKADITVKFGKGGDTPVVGDWNGAGKSEIGVFRESTGYWYLDYNFDGIADKTVKFGKGGDTLVVGDWNNTGITGIGVFRKSTGYWYLDFNNEGTADKTVKLGKAGDIPVVGDWNGAGKSEIGVFRESTGYWYLDYNFDGIVDKTVKLGKGGDTQVVGDWNGAGTTGIGVFRKSTNYWYLDSNLDGTIDYQFRFGTNNDIPEVGHWA